MAHLLSVNVGTPTPTDHSRVPVTGIDKRPAPGPVAISVPAGEQTGVAGDHVCDTAVHGGPDKAVYAFAREDLDRWAGELGRDLRGGVFGENLTTLGVDVTGARIGERWLIGAEVVLEVCQPRIPCRTFAAWLGERDWMRRFTEDARPGAYLRVVQPGSVRAGDGIRIVHTPAHDVTIGLAFRALTTSPELLPELVPALALPARTREKVLSRLERAL